MSVQERDVYVLKSNARYKIGIAADIEKRVRQLQTGNSYPILVFCRFETEDAERAEKWMHERYKASRIAGEWFRLTRRQVLELQLIEENECLDDIIDYTLKHGDISYEEMRDLGININIYLMSGLERYAHFNWSYVPPEEIDLDTGRKIDRYEIYDKGCPVCSTFEYSCHIQPRCEYHPRRMLCGGCGYIWTESTLAYEILVYGHPLALGQKVIHPIFGRGSILKNDLSRIEWGREVVVTFTDAGKKKLLVTAAKLKESS